MNDLDTLAVVHPNAAGLDIGSREIWAAIRPDHPGETAFILPEQHQQNKSANHYHQNSDHNSNEKQ